MGVIEAAGSALIGGEPRRRVRYMTGSSILEAPPETVYLSELTFDANSAFMLRALSDMYRVHQYVMTAFPAKNARGENLARVLYRLEPEDIPGTSFAARRFGQIVRILVQSTDKPRWDLLGPESNTALPLRIRGPKEWTLRRDGKPMFHAGQQLRFKLRANPTTTEVPVEGEEGNDTLIAPTGETVRKRTDRALLGSRAQGDWLARKGVDWGFSLPEIPTGTDWMNAFADEKDPRETNYDIRITPLGMDRGLKGARTNEDGTEEKGHQILIYGVEFEGVLTVTDPERFVTMLAAGIGRARGFGYGLMSVAPPTA